MPEGVLIVMDIEPRPGEVWRDMVNLDLLLVKEIDPRRVELVGDKIVASLRYARCLAFCKPGTFSTLPAMQFMGTQEMQFKHFNGPRFQRLGWFKAIYYRWKMKKWQKSGGM